MKKTLSATLLCIPFFLAATPVVAEEPRYNVVNFRESVTVNVANDTMNVVLAITETAKNRQIASNTVTHRLNRVLAKIKTNKALHSETRNRHVYPEYDDNNRIIGWKDTAEISINSTDFSALSTLIAEVQNDAMIRHFYYSVSPDKYAAAIEQASEQALKAFQNRAQTVSHTLGFHDYKLVNLNLNNSFEQNSEDIPVAAAAPMMMRQSSRGHAVMSNNPGTQEIRQTVNGSIEMQ